jgi:hypothetical protein
MVGPPHNEAIQMNKMCIIRYDDRPTDRPHVYVALQSCLTTYMNSFVAACCGIFFLRWNVGWLLLLLLLPRQQ